MKRQDIADFRIQKIISDQDQYEFPLFLRMLRRMCGMQRRCVSEDTGIAETRLFYLENGRFKRRLGVDEIRLLSEYYDVPCKLLEKKVTDFLDSGKARPQGQKHAV
jgi:hypothetical protein